MGVDIAKDMEKMSIISVHPVNSCIKRPWLIKRNVNKARRLEFAKKHVNNCENFWKNVVFSDESKFNLFG